MTFFSYINPYTSYEWTAFRDSDLLKSGDTGLGYGDCFTMPASSTVCLSTSDNDRSLSGDGWWDDCASDGSGQDAWVDGHRVGGQFYAESYHVLHGSDGKKYYLIEIEIEGSHDEYFSFFGDVPAAGVELKIVQTCDVSGDWLDYSHLGAGPKEPPVEYGSVSGLVWSDDCDGIQNFEVSYEKGADVWCDSVTYESVTCTTYNVCDYGSWKSTAAQVIDLVVGNEQGHHGNAHGNTIVELDKGGVWARGFHVEENGKFCLSFDTYKNSCVGDQGNTIAIKVNGHVVETVVVGADGKVELNLDLAKGYNKIEFVSKSDVTGYGAGIDNTALVKLKEVSTFAEMPTAGVTVKLIDAATGDVVATQVTDAHGKYSFDNVPVGDYKIMGVAPDGTEFTIKDAGSDDSVDSDVGSDGVSDMFTVAKDKTTDIDLGLCEKAADPGSLSGRYFCDTDRDNRDNGNGAEPGVAGVVVTLLTSKGLPALDIDGNEVASVRTDDDGKYAFANLAAGVYTVKFTDPNGALAGKQLVTPNIGDDAADSDAIGDTTMSVISNIVVEEGSDTPDNDAGAFTPNENPTAIDDAGKGCADELIFVDFSDNFSDADSASVGIATIGGQSIGDGETVVIEGVNVTLTGGVFSFDGEAAYAPLGVGEEVSQTFVVTVQDSDGGSASANIDVTFCGVYDTVEELEASITDTEISFQIIDGNFGSVSPNAFTLLLTDAGGDARLDNVTFTEAYCLGAYEDILRGANGSDIAMAPKLTGTISLLDDDSFLGSAPESQTLADSNPEIDDNELDNMINYILNQDYGSKGYTDSEVQGAIWGITDDIVFVASGTGSAARAQEILDDAIALGQDYTAGQGDIVGLYIDPSVEAEDRGHTQPFLIGIVWDECLCA